MSKVHECIDCGVDTMKSGEIYHVRNALWAEALGEVFVGTDRISPVSGEPTYRDDEIDTIQDRGMLCIACIETRLGRQLTPEDFTHAPVNSGDEGRLKRSSRMLDRLGLTTNER